MFCSVHRASSSRLRSLSSFLFITSSARAARSRSARAIPRRARSSPPQSCSHSSAPCAAAPSSPLHVRCIVLARMAPLGLCLRLRRDSVGHPPSRSAFQRTCAGCVGRVVAHGVFAGLGVRLSRRASRRSCTMAASVCTDRAGRGPRVGVGASHTARARRSCTIACTRACPCAACSPRPPSVLVEQSGGSPDPSRRWAEQRQPRR